MFRSRKALTIPRHNVEFWQGVLCVKTPDCREAFSNSSCVCFDVLKTHASPWKMLPNTVNNTNRVMPLQASSDRFASVVRPMCSTWRR